MHIQSAEVLTAQAEAFINSLPPSRNPYLFLSEFVSDQVIPPTYSKPIQRLVIAFAVIFALKFIFAVFAVIYFCALDKRFWVVRVTRDGLWQTNTRLLYALLASAFCATNTASLIRQALIDAGQLDMRNRMTLEGLRWIPLWMSGWVMIHSIAACSVQTYLEMGGRGQAKPGGGARTSKEVALVWSINSFCVLVPVGVIASLAVVFGISNSELNALLDSAYALFLQLVVAGTQYNSATYQPSDLAPYLAQTQTVFEHWVKMQRYFHLGFGLYAIYIALIIVFFAPFLLRHIIVIRRLMRPTTRPSHGGPLSGAGQAAGEPSRAISASFAPQPPTRSESDLTLNEATPTRKGVPTAASHVSIGNTGQDRQQRALRADLRSLLWSAVIVFAAEVIYLPLTTYAALADIRSAAFWVAELIWGNVAYIVCGLVANFMFVQRPLVQAWLKRRRAKSSGGAKVEGPAMSEVRSPRPQSRGDLEADVNV